jgi:hypothetical protein
MSQSRCSSLPPTPSQVQQLTQTQALHSKLTPVLAPHFTILSTMETFVISKEELPSEPRDTSQKEDRPTLEAIIGIKNTESFVGSITLMLTTWRQYMLAHYM